MLTDIHKNASAREVKKCQYRIATYQTTFPVKSYRINMIDLKEFYHFKNYKALHYRITDSIDYRTIKFNISVYGTYIKQIDEGVTVETMMHHD